MTQSNNISVGVNVNPGQVAVGKLTTNMGTPSQNIWSNNDLRTLEVRSTTGQGVVWKDLPLKDTNHIGRLTYPLLERERMCYGYRPLLAELHSPVVFVKVFPDSDHFVFAMFGKEEIEIFGDATIPTTEEIHALVMFNGKWLTLLKYLEKAELIDV